MLNLGDVFARYIDRIKYVYGEVLFLNRIRKLALTPALGFSYLTAVVSNDFFDTVFGFIQIYLKIRMI